MQIIGILTYPVSTKSVGQVCRIHGEVHVWPYATRPYNGHSWLKIKFKENLSSGLGRDTKPQIDGQTEEQS
jgi:hypothetical protein